MEKVSEKFWQEMMKAKPTPDAGKKMKTTGQRDFKSKLLGFPGGSVVKNPPANAGGPGLISGPERSHMLWSN